VFFLLLAIAVPFVVIIALFGVEGFSFVFGKKWSMAGNFAVTLSVAVAVRFSVSPLSVVLQLNHNLKKAVRWQLLYFLTITTTLTVASGFSMETFLLAFVIHEVLLYGLYLGIILFASRGIAAGK
jgi:O-antigen/teichoic acid export membrane protein